MINPRRLYLGRDLLSWVILLLGILNLIIAINSSFRLINVLSSFVAGICFCQFMTEGFMQRYSKLLKLSMRFTEDIIRINERLKSQIKVKGGLK